MEFRLDKFVLSPSVEGLAQCRKADLLMVAEFYNVPVLRSARKAEIRDVLLAKLRDDGRLPVPPDSRSPVRAQPAVLSGVEGAGVAIGETGVLSPAEASGQTLRTSPGIDPVTTPPGPTSLAELDLNMAVRLKELDLAIKQQERETQLLRVRALELEASRASSHRQPVTRSLEFDISKHSSLVPPFRESEVDSYFTAFERVAATLHWPKDMLLQCKLVEDDYVNVRLMVTTCRKDEQKGFGHRNECVTQQPKTPWIDCVVCQPKNGEELIDCVRQMDATSRVDIRRSCPISSVYRREGGSIMSYKSEDKVIRKHSELSDPHTTSKMKAVLKLLLLSAVTLLVSAQEWKNYWSLPASYRGHIDKALHEANRKLGGPYHVAYESILKVKDDYVNVRLMVTKCKKDKQKGFGHRNECVTQKPKTPWIDCVVCQPKNGEELIDCVRRMDAASRVDIRKNCSGYLLGSETPFFQIGEDDEPQIGCPGCV
ncbi:hypothetical protein MHYP_G00006130 [Metynnis hypsauchen]